MRPKRRVLLYCADYDRRNDLAFLLRVRCTWARIEMCASVEELAEELYDTVTLAPQFDCVVLVTAEKDWLYREAEQAAVDELLLGNANVAARAIEVRDRCDMEWSAGAVRRIPGDRIGMLMEEMKIAAARKRGPKKMVKDHPVVALLEAVAKKTHCKHGHMMTPRNVYRRANGVANCRACTRASKITFRKRATR